MDSIDLYVNNVFQVTLAGFDQVSSALGPSWVPLFCGMCQITGSVGNGSGGTASATVFGGYRAQIAGTWYAAPSVPPPAIVNAPTSGPATPPFYGTVTAPFGLSLGGTIITSSTYGNQLSLVYAGTVGGGYANTEGVGGWVIPVANLPKSIVRMNSDFAASFYAFASPQVQGSSNRVWGHIAPPTTNYSGHTGSVTTVFNRTVPIVQEVSATPSSAEAAMQDVSYSMGYVTHNKLVASPGPTLDEESYYGIYPATMDTLAQAQVAPYMQHADIRANYFNSAIVHPHWSIGYWTSPPPNPAWSGGQSWEGYWGPVREQYLSNQQKRNHIVSCPLESSGYAGAGNFLDSFFGGLRWIGVSRWQTQTFSPLTNLTLDLNSSPAWTPFSTSCTLAFGSAITITPGASVCVFDLDLARFDCPPYFYAQLAASVFLNWPTTNISSVSVFAKSSDGTTLAIFELNPGDGFTTPNETYPMPFAGDAKYAGSWGIDNGDGVVTDTGIDVPSGGMSPAIMNDVRRQMAFGMLLGLQAAYLHFEVTPIDDTMTCQIDYPKFTAATQKTLIQENGQIADQLYWNGPGIRWSNHVWYDIAFQDPPLYSGLGYKPSVIDWLADRRILLQAVGPTAGTPNLATECTELYDSFEGQSVGQVDDDSIAFMLPQDPKTVGDPAWKAALVNTYSEVPPLAGFPAFDRNPSTWAQTSSLCQRVWAWCQLPRRISTTSNKADLAKPDGTIVTTLSTIAAKGWIITESSPVVNNLESVNWQILTGGSGGTVWAHVTPWHGWYCLLASSPPCTQPYLWQDILGVLSKNCTKNSDIWFYKSDSTTPIPQWEVTAQATMVGNAVKAQHCKDLRGIYYLVFQDSGHHLWEIISYDDGRTWTTPTAMALPTPANNVHNWAGHDGSIVRAAHVYNTGSSGVGKINATYQNAGDPSQSSVFIFTDNTGAQMVFEDEGFGLALAHDGPLRWLLSAVIAGESNSSDWQSWDMANLAGTGQASFTRVSP